MNLVAIASAPVLDMVAMTVAHALGKLGRSTTVALQATEMA